MKFEEDYPSLQKTNMFEMINNSEIDNVIHVIEDNTIDKQKVKEVVTAYLDNYQCRKNKQTRLNRDGILKELGLEEEE